METIMNFVEKVKHGRTKLNLTQEQFARELNVSFATFNRWQSSQCKPSCMGERGFIEFSKLKRIKEFGK